ncbi:hypothetical protein [Streptomyces sp. NPDC057302]|uniref:hypothetical protein n=1 Tax=Streptomyces sp. NPDC057302 TaxID=3346094 RepID=UPI003642D078
MPALEIDGSVLPPSPGHLRQVTGPLGDPGVREMGQEMLAVVLEVGHRMPPLRGRLCSALQLPPEPFEIVLPRRAEMDAELLVEGPSALRERLVRSAQEDKGGDGGEQREAQQIAQLRLLGLGEEVRCEIGAAGVGEPGVGEGFEGLPVERLEDVVREPRLRQLLHRLVVEARGEQHPQGRACAASCVGGQPVDEQAAVVLVDLVEGVDEREPGRPLRKAGQCSLTGVEVSGRSHRALQGAPHADQLAGGHQERYECAGPGSRRQRLVAQPQGAVVQQGGFPGAGLRLDE